ncbi:serine/threonine-protein kinase [Chloroflexi bacterium TSY]|nr:serine/threonine-protein kinase [Chloroflexi bacterium TSY]
MVATLLSLRGYDTLYDRDVAIKILPPYLTQDRNSVRRFVTEGREATRLRHVHIVEVYDAGQVDGYVYVAQQLAEGGTLAERLDGQESIIVPRGSFAPHLTPANFIRPRQDKTFLSGYSEEEAILLIEQIAAALDYAHSNGISHGTLQPKNVLLTSDNHVLLTNFRAATVEAEEELVVRLVGEMDIAQLAYFAPEQASGQIAVAPACDIFALGVIAYRLFTGRLPFVSEHPLALLRMTIDEAPTAPDELNPELVPAIIDGLNKALAKEPSERFRSAGAFATALRQGPTYLEQTNLVTDRQEVVLPSISESSLQRKIESRELSREIDHVEQIPLRNIQSRLLRRRNKAISRSTIHSKFSAVRKRPLSAAIGIGVGLIGILLMFFVLVQWSDLILPELDVVGTRLDLDADSPTDWSDVGRQNFERVAEGDSPENGDVADESSTRLSKEKTSETQLKTTELTVQEKTSAQSNAEFVPIPLTTYEEPGGTYQIAMPIGFETLIDNNRIRFESAELPIQFLIQKVVNLSATDTPEILLDKYLSENVLADNTALQNAQLVHEGSVVVGDHQGYERTFEAEILGQKIVVRLISVEYEGTGYVVTASVDSNHSIQLATLVDAVIYSFDLKQPAPLTTHLLEPKPAVESQPVPVNFITPTVTPSPTRDLPTPIPPKPTEEDSEFLFASTIDLSLSDADVGTIQEATTVTFPTSDLLPPGPPPSGHIAYAIWNPVTDRMDTYIYSIVNDVSWPRLANKRQPDFRFDGELIVNGEGGDIDNLVRTWPNSESYLLVSEHPEDSRPHWSASGKQFVFDSTFVGDRRHRIYLQPDATVRQSVSPIMYEAWELFGRFPIFLANNTIAYQGCNVWENGGSCGIYNVELGGGRPHSMTDWPEDIPTDNLDTQILFMSNRDRVDNVDNWDVYLIPTGIGQTRETKVRRLTQHPGRDGLATASPDGNHIAFVTDRDGIWSVYIMRIDGSNKRKLFDLQGEYGRGEQNWHQDWKQERISWGW